uniref:Sema domain-containing protein n=1 Tax=Petromyzon marinus TaxID=7757 RepID=S4RB28_PETMA
SVLLLEPERGALFVGARGAVLRLTAANPPSQRHLCPQISWDVEDSSRQLCIGKGKTVQDECHNHVRALHLNGSRLLACGTGAFSPLCAHFSSNLFSFTFYGTCWEPRVLCQVPVHCCPLFADNSLYLATSKDFQAKQNSIFRADGSHRMFMIEKSAATLNDPTFVASEVVEPGEGGGGRHVYFFFTETAMEYDYIFQPRVARVARVC